MVTVLATADLVTVFGHKIQRKIVNFWDFLHSGVFPCEEFNGIKLFEWKIFLGIKRIFVKNQNSHKMCTSFFTPRKISHAKIFIHWILPDGKTSECKKSFKISKIDDFSLYLVTKNRDQRPSAVFRHHWTKWKGLYGFFLLDLAFFLNVAKPKPLLVLL